MRNLSACTRRFRPPIARSRFPSTQQNRTRQGTDVGLIRFSTRVTEPRSWQSTATGSAIGFRASPDIQSGREPRGGSTARILRPCNSFRRGRTDAWRASMLHKASTPQGGDRSRCLETSNCGQNAGRGEPRGGGEVHGGPSKEITGDAVLGLREVAGLGRSLDPIVHPATDPERRHPTGVRDTRPGSHRHGCGDDTDE